ncbi:MAG: flagellar motor protein MotB [Treponema sp.]|uniref:flagellar motor protein MotB n=1 Tax=Treponema sp. TaxID=166 RepID=UPI003FA31A5A
MARKKKEVQAAGSGWLTTYGDMVTLMLCFFVMLYEPSEVDITRLQALSASISGDPTGGSISLAAGKLADLGNTISSMPSMEKGRLLGTALKKAVSLFAPEIKSNKIAVTSDERGLVISLAADSFFPRNSAELNIEESRETLLRISQFLSDKELATRRFRIEGHTDSGASLSETWKSNWELSSARAINVLHYLTDFGAQEDKFSIAGYADTRPVYSNETEEGRAYNRRVDIIILDDAHF